MRKFKMVVFALVLSMAGCVEAKNLSAWLLGDTDSLMARVGYNTTTNTEVGLEAAWFELDGTPGNAGIYGIYKWPDLITVPNPLPFDFLPKEVTGKVYGGVQMGIDILNRGTFVGPIAGMIIQDIIIVEYQYISADFKLGQIDGEQKIILGMRFEF